MHASKGDPGSTVNTLSKPSSNDTTPHVISSVTKPGIHFSLAYAWILDSGASDHVCPNLQHFSTYKKISPIPVKLPNGEIILAQNSGTIFSTSDFYLHNVLHIPNFHFNLISIHKLTNSLNCRLLFSPTICVIQAPPTLRTIGLAEVQNNLYIIRQQPQIVSYTHNSRDSTMHNYVINASSIKNQILLLICGTID